MALSGLLCGTPCEAIAMPSQSVQQMTTREHVPTSERRNNTDSVTLALPHLLLNSLSSSSSPSSSILVLIMPLCGSSSGSPSFGRGRPVRLRPLSL